MSEHPQQGCEWTISGRERPTIETIRNNLIKKELTNAQLKPNILINAMIHDEKKYDLARSKAAGIISKLVADQHQPIIEGKSSQEAWNILQERFQHINPMSTSRIIYEATTKKLFYFKNVHEYTSHYQAFFDIFRQDCRFSDRHLLLHLLKHQNVLSSYYADEYGNGILGFDVSNSKQLDERVHKPGREGPTNHPAFQIHKGKQKC